MNSYDDNDLTALNRLEDLLDAYCDTRLMPRGAVLSRIRTVVLAEATAAAPATTDAAVATTRTRSVPAPMFVGSFRPRFARAAFTLGFAAALTLGTAAAVLASPPGSLFYNARVYLETALLPTQQDPRFEGHERLLDERFAEAEAAANRNDPVALAAALAAYQAEVDASSADAGNELSRLAHLQEVLAKHSAALTVLAERLPEQTSIEHAIEASSKAITKLNAREHPAIPARPQRPTGTGSGGGSANQSGLGQNRGSQ